MLLRGGVWEAATKAGEAAACTAVVAPSAEAAAVAAAVASARAAPTVAAAET